MRDEEVSIMRFRKKKYYREVKCKTCAGTGKKEYLEYWGYEPYSALMRMSQGICLACNGRGTQTVLKREE